MLALRVFETVLAADDLEVAARFYRDVLGLEIIAKLDVLVAFRCAGSVLLIFDPKLSSAPGRSVPPHGTSGAGHVAFAAKAEELDGWRARLEQAGVSIEAIVDW